MARNQANAVWTGVLGGADLAAAAAAELHPDNTMAALPTATPPTLDHMALDPPRLLIGPAVLRIRRRRPRRRLQHAEQLDVLGHREEVERPQRRHRPPG